MAKKKYMKPIMALEGFVPEQYCKVCGVVQGSTLTANCGGSNVTMKITSAPGGAGEMTVTAVDGYTDVGTGTIYPDMNDNSSYSFVGSINKDHDSKFYTGEYIGKDAASAEDKAVGETVSGGQKVCEHKLASETFHHHLTNVVISTNHS